MCFIRSKHNFVLELVAGEDAGWEAQGLFIQLVMLLQLAEAL